MLIKPGVDISRLERNTRRGLQGICDVYRENDSVLIMKSTYEGNHMEGSLHYAHRAFDTSHPEKNPEHVTILCIKKLGKNWDVVAKSDHIHWEYDPKNECLRMRYPPGSK